MQDAPLPTSALPEALGRLMRDPALLSRIGEIVNTASAKTPAEEAPVSAPTASAASATPLPASSADPVRSAPSEETNALPAGIFPAVPGPALLEMLPTLLSSLGGHPTPGSTGRGKGPMAEREALLCALKPFLSPSRREAVDTVLRVARLGELLQRLQSGQERS